MNLSPKAISAIEAVMLPALALAGALVLFGGFVLVAGKSPLEAWGLLFKGAFGDWFSWQNTLVRAAPLMLTALCVAIPAQAGMVLIGGEGALVMGGLGCAALPYLFAPPENWIGSTMLMLAGIALGALWMGIVGALKQYRGVNETISSLLMVYIGIALFKHFVEGPMKDPASLNKPSTRPIAEALRIGSIGGSDVHWGLVIGALCCLLVGIWLFYSINGFAVRVAGGNPRTALLVGLPSHRLAITACAAGGGFAGLAGAIEVSAVHTAANASLIAGAGYTGILVSFVARHNPWAVVPVAVLFGGFGAAGSLLQRRMNLPDASVLMLQGFAFVLILATEALRGRLILPGAAPAASAPVATAPAAAIPKGVDA
jgi:simple sugar transport system permease protein